jgi:hypothetical protein
MQRAVIRIGIVLAALSACGPLVAGPPYSGATSEQYDWQGTWESAYNKEITYKESPGRFPWEFTRIKDAFQANFSFSVDANGKVRGEAHGSIFYRLESDGCGTISHPENSCVIRCKANAMVQGDTADKGTCYAYSTHENQIICEPRPPHPDIYPRYVPDVSLGENAAIPVTGQLNGTTVHLKLGPPDYLVAFDNTGTCVGPNGSSNSQIRSRS